VDGRSGREVAAKVVNVRRFRENPKLEECTLNEIEVLTRIDCPHIVRFIEILKTVNNFYFFYEFCNAGTLDQEIRRHGFLPEPRVLAFLEQLVEAFRILTASNIMHRDLKPSNIMLHNGAVKLGDFGFCKSLESQRDLAQTMLGSPIYMAPEVLRGEIYTVKADIWSLGVVVYEMAFGFCPFQESSIARLINVLEHQDLQINRDINPISPQLEELLRLMLVKDHFKRISWEELLAYSFRGGRLARTSTHHRALSETNRLLRKESLPEKGEDAKGQLPADTRFYKKRGQAEEGE
jgi:serine/threonine-protein kinase ULK/ATG1